MSPSAIEPVSLSLGASNPEAFARALGASFAAHGFAVVSDHGLPEVRLAEVLTATKAFFALTEDRKRAYQVARGAGQRGYTPFGLETAKGAEHSDLKEFWHVGRDLPIGHPYRAIMPANLWPKEISNFRSSATWLFEALETLGGVCLSAIALYLDLPPDHFEDATRDGNSILRLLHYPPSAFDGPNIRAGAHEDINAITLLLGAEEAGLEILERDGRWLAINPPPGSVVVNIGDMLARLTNDVLPSTTHRVVNPAPERRGEARYSLPFFLHFQPDFLIETLPGCISAARPDRYPTPITADAFLRQRLREINLA
jgi:isopenicillin N synthase-like dioxygenase